MRNDYEREWKQPWRFHGPGYVLMQDDVHCEVLRVGFESEMIGLTIERERPIDPDLTKAADHVPYPYWFDIVEDRADARRLASFAMASDARGPRAIERSRASASFPRGDAPQCRPRAEWPGTSRETLRTIRSIPSPFRFSATSASAISSKGMKMAPSETAFYWRFYAPMMESILSDNESSR